MNKNVLVNVASMISSLKVPQSNKSQSHWM